MILFTLRFMLCISVFYLLYKAFLEQEKTYRFNRFFLLLGIPVSLVTPLISGNTAPAVKQAISSAETLISEQVVSWETITIYLLSGIYVLMVFLLLTRFCFDIYVFMRLIAGQEKARFKKATVVFHENATAPFTFLHYIFMKKENLAQLHPDLMEHELTHVRQKHTFDILLIELLRIAFWFHPVVHLYKSAIRLNHEFLADNAVLGRQKNVSRYQHLLLDYMGGSPLMRLSSAFHFKLTKKRFSMMTKKESRWQYLKMLVVSPFLVITFMACSDNPGATGREMLEYWRATAAIEEIMAAGEMSEADLENGILVPIETREQYEKLQQIYQKMNGSQRESVYKLPAFLPPLSAEECEKQKEKKLTE